MTEWRQIWEPYGAYEVSDAGDVRRGGRLLTGCVDRYGYRKLLLSSAGVAKGHKVHRLVCQAFHGTPPTPAHEVGHLNGVRLDNRAENLAWVTRSENNRHQVAHGTHVGSRNLPRGRPRPSKYDREAALADAKAGMGGRKLAKKYGICRSTAHRYVIACLSEAETPNLSRPIPDTLNAGGCE